MRIFLKDIKCILAGEWKMVGLGCAVVIWFRCVAPTGRGAMGLRVETPECSVGGSDGSERWGKFR
jgi:hypothetical protein